MKYIMVLMLFCVGCADADLSQPMEVCRITQYKNNICDYELYDDQQIGTDTFRAPCELSKVGQFMMIANGTIAIVDRPENWRK